eukprot:scaffold50214_cov65-Phaeocystis_antarctica.AAC.3
MDGAVSAARRGLGSLVARRAGERHHSSSSIYQIPNTEHMAYRLVRTLVYKRGVGIRETVWVGVWFRRISSCLLLITSLLIDYSSPHASLYARARSH